MQSVLSSACGQRDFSRKGLSENFPFAKICVRPTSCAAVCLLWNLQWPWAGRGNLARHSSVLLQGRGHPREEGEDGKEEGLTLWSDGRAACPAGSTGDGTVLTPWDVPNPMPSGGLCLVALPVEQRT